MDIRLTPTPGVFAASYQPRKRPDAPLDSVTLGHPQEPVTMEQAARVLSARATHACRRLEAQHLEEPGAIARYNPVLTPDGKVLVNGARGTHLVDLEGRRLSTLETGDCTYQAPRRGHDGRWFVRDDTNLKALAPDGKSILWDVPVRERGTSGAPEVGPDGTLYVADNDRTLRILTPDGRETGSLRWESLQSITPRLRQDGKLIVQGYEGRQALVDPAAPRFLRGPGPKLETVIEGDALRRTGIGPDGTRYRVADGKTLTVTGPDGTTWEHDLGRYDASVHVRLREDGVIYVLSGHNRLLALSPGGEELFTWDAPGRGVSWDFVLDEEGNAYLPGAAGNWSIYSLDKAGNERWTQDLSSQGGDAALGPKGTLLVANSLGPFRILDRANGAPLHEEFVDTAFSEGPFVATEDGRVLVFTARGDVVPLQITSPQELRDQALAETAPQEVRWSYGEVLIGDTPLAIEA